VPGEADFASGGFSGIFTRPAYQDRLPGAGATRGVQAAGQAAISNDPQAPVLRLGGPAIPGPGILAMDFFTVGGQDRQHMLTQNVRQHMLTDMESALEIARSAASTDPDVGLRAVASLRALTERLEIVQVENARKLGWSWQDIAGRLGVTKQTVHRKHGKRFGSR
jgi:hypothetical protein